MPFYLAWLCKKGQCTKKFFWLLTHLSDIFAPYIKNLEMYFAILICFEFWPLWFYSIGEHLFGNVLHDQETCSVLEIGFSLSKWPHFHDAYDIGILIYYATAVDCFITFIGPQATSMVSVPQLERIFDVRTGFYICSNLLMYKSKSI